jgi:hypothetical protein
MFNLDQAIAKWRQEMTAAGVKTPRVRDELESHLREDIQNRVRSGAGSEQAFAEAVKQLGAGVRLKQEFEKVARERKRSWLRASSVVGGTLFAYSAVFVSCIFAHRAGRFEITVPDLLLYLGAMLATMFFGFTGRYFARFLPIVLNEKLQAVYIAAAIFLDAGLLRTLWEHLALDNFAHVQIILLWTMSPLLGFGHCASAWCERAQAACAQLKPANA